jgi:hypothetical protein
MTQGAIVTQVTNNNDNRSFQDQRQFQYQGQLQMSFWLSKGDPVDWKTATIEDIIDAKPRQSINSFLKDLPPYESYFAKVIVLYTGERGNVYQVVYPTFLKEKEIK